jgi:hypothetical protein
MSGFTVPNATDLAASLIASLDQSEPDSLDFQIVGNRRNAVFTGAVPTLTTAASNATPAYVNIALTAAEVMVNGVIYSVPAATVILGAAPVNARFDFVCAQVNGASCGYVVVPGTNSATNPIFPALTSSQLPLYAVYVKSGYNSTAIDKITIDKRVFATTSPVRTGSGAPANSLGNVGDLYVRSDLVNVGRQSQLYVKVEATTWENLAEYAQLTGDVTTSGAVATISNASISSAKLGSVTLSTVATGTRAIVAGDENTIIRMGASTPVAELNTTVVVGTTIHFMQTTTTQVSFSVASGTLNSAVGATPKLRTQWSVATAVRYDATNWVVFGDIV